METDWLVVLVGCSDMILLADVLFQHTLDGRALGGFALDLAACAAFYASSAVAGTGGDVLYGVALAGRLRRCAHLPPLLHALPRNTQLGPQTAVLARVVFLIISAAEWAASLWYPQLSNGELYDCNCTYVS